MTCSCELTNFCLLLVPMCPLEYPFAYQSGKMCCRTQNDFRLGCMEEEREDLEGVSMWNVTCCIESDRQPCHRSHCTHNDQGKFKHS